MAKRQKMITNITALSGELTEILWAVQTDVSDFHEISEKYDKRQIPFSAFQAGQQIILPGAKKKLPRMVGVIKKLEKEVKNLDKHMQKWNADKKLKNLFRKGDLKASKKEALQLVKDQQKYIADMKYSVKYWNEMLTLIYNVK